MKTLDSILTVLDKWVSVVAITLNLLILAINVFARYFFSHSFHWADDVGRYLLIILVYMSASYAVKTDSHLRIDGVMSLHPKKLRPWVSLLGNLIWVVYCGFIVYITWEYTLHYMRLHSMIASLPIPIWPIYASMPLGHLTMGLRVIMCDVIPDIRKIIHKEAVL